MSMSDCSHCWETPCICGWDFRNHSPERLEKYRELFAKIIVWKKAHPDAMFSEYGQPTEDDIAFGKAIGAIS